MIVLRVQGDAINDSGFDAANHMRLWNHQEVSTQLDTSTIIICNFWGFFFSQADKSEDNKEQQNIDEQMEGNEDIPTTQYKELSLWYFLSLEVRNLVWNEWTAQAKVIVLIKKRYCLSRIWS